MGVDWHFMCKRAITFIEKDLEIHKTPEVVIFLEQRKKLWEDNLKKIKNGR